VVSESKVFVYGSLLPGCSNHFVIAEANSLGSAQTKPEFELLDLGEYPGLVTGGATCVQGLVYLVDAQLLTRLDEFEGHPNLFQRREITLNNGQNVQAYVYLSAKLGASVVASGDWAAFVRSRENLP
jgi:gamma-glutamylcyclotransferase (GGCT)/AIG2-like uncharacterized protein YtfP